MSEETFAEVLKGEFPDDFEDYGLLVRLGFLEYDSDIVDTDGGYPSKYIRYYVKIEFRVGSQIFPQGITLRVHDE
jgi:hypothetical protein